MASGPITSWEIDGETVETGSDFIFLGSKITADGDCRHEIKRCLLLGRKVMTNLDSILKSRDITLLAHYSFSSVQLLSRVWLFLTPWIAARQASLPIANSRATCVWWNILHSASLRTSPAFNSLMKTIKPFIYWRSVELLAKKNAPSY